MKASQWIIILILCNNLWSICCFLFYSTGSSSGRPPNYSYTDSWTSEELWPKEKSIIHVKLVRPSPKKVPVWELRNKDKYLLDPILDFDSPFISSTLNDCLIEYKAIDSDSDELIQVQISGPQCATLPLTSLRFHNNLTHLVIRDTALTDLTKFVFGAAKLDRLKRIDIISNNLLNRIHARAFDGLSQLAYLSLINNKRISDISVEAFVGLKNLEELIWISNGGVTHKTFLTLTRASSVRILPTLIHLHISGLMQSNYETNLINTGLSLSNSSSSSPGFKVNKDDLIFLTHLKYLQLTNCDIEYIHPLAFVPLNKSLNGLNLSGNTKLDVSSLRQSLINGFQLNSIHSAIDKLDISATFSTKVMPKVLLSVISKTKISELYLNHMKINQIVFGDIPPMPYLRTLHIEFSELEYIEENSFQTLEELVKLSLRGNFLRTISQNLIYNLPKLEYLDLSGYKNNRTYLEIPHKTFIGTNLKEVNLSYKLLDPLPRNAFLGLFKMQRFHLRGCGLKFVEYLTFFPLKSAVYIDLSENNELISTLRDTHEDSLFGLEAIEMVRMSNCNLTSRDINDDESIFKRIHEHVQLLDLSHNLIDRISAKTFSNFTELQHLDLSYNNIDSWTNFSLFSKNKYITTLDISHNKISRLTSSMVEDFHLLKNLSFAMNPLICDCKSHIVADWLNDTTFNIHYLRNRHPLHSKSQYYCLSNEEKIDLKTFITDCKNIRYESTRVSLKLLSAIASILLLLALIFLILAFVYHSTLRSFINGFEDDCMHDYQYDAFVSYNVNDSEWVFKQLVPNIENNDLDSHRIKLCVYDRDFIAGRPISECILESIKTSRKVILVISNNFVRSPWCRFETDLAHNTLVDQNRDGLIMIKLEEIDSAVVAPQLHYLLKTRIYLQWNLTNLKEQEVFWKKLRRALGFNSTKRQDYYYCSKETKTPIVLAPNKDNNLTPNVKEHRKTIVNDKHDFILKAKKDKEIQIAIPLQT